MTVEEKLASVNKRNTHVDSAGHPGCTLHMAARSGGGRMTEWDWEERERRERKQGEKEREERRGEEAGTDRRS